ncbi:hypothetical protein [Bacillus paralicheniformis]|uniref:hypothetical protein n=1 Tax=Bacillus paralicheniformis TaxID=1648923 RepID=UPI002242F7C3|nr:hypothetical protein [Bacillus paralicheniformis]UZN53076.1 hypothetical protein OPU65_13820 [Bacillus paralicheniformis]
MKKFLILSLALCLGIILGACGSTDTAKKDDNKKETTASENKKSDSKKENEDVQEDGDMKATTVFTNKNVNIKGTSGPMKYEISAIQLKELEPKTEDAASLLDAKVGDKINAVTIEMEGENTSDKDISFYLGQAKIITDTKEQLEPEMLLSEHIEGEYLGKVKNKGHNVYILKNSSVKDLKSIEIRVDAPIDDNADSLGKDVKHTIEVNN